MRGGVVPPKQTPEHFLPLGLRCILPRNVQLSKIENPLMLAQWWACLESNQGPRPYQGRALTN